MKNYIITQCEYDTTMKRLERLYERRIKLKNKMTNCTSALKQVATFGNATEDKMTNYVEVAEDATDKPTT